MDNTTSNPTANVNVEAGEAEAKAEAILKSVAKPESSTAKTVLKYAGWTAAVAAIAAGAYFGWKYASGSGSDANDAE